MKNFISIIILIMAAALAGVLIERYWWSTAASDTAANGEVEREILYWQAQMDPAYRSESPGKSPMGMDLIPVYADEAHARKTGVVSIDPKIVNSLGVRTAKVKTGTLSRRIQTVGYIAYDEDTLYQVNSRVEGWVQKLAVKATGDPVKKGQVLFELYSPALVNAQKEFVAALQSRSTSLHTASRERLAAFGISASEIKRLEKQRTVKQRIPVYAQADGVISSLAVREGAFITPATNIMAIARLDRVWIMAEVFERQSSWVAIGQMAEVELDYLPGTRLQGTVDYIYPELDAKTRTLKVRLRFDNDEQVLRPNMFARVVIFAPGSQPMLHIPREALIRSGTVSRVVVALGDGQFRSQVVEAGMESGSEVEIRSGLAAGDQVVTSGQFLIDSESNIQTALEKVGGATKSTIASPDTDHSQHDAEAGQ